MEGLSHWFDNGQFSNIKVTVLKRHSDSSQIFLQSKLCNAVYSASLIYEQKRVNKRIEMNRVIKICLSCFFFAKS